MISVCISSPFVIVSSFGVFLFPLFSVNSSNLGIHLIKRPKLSTLILLLFAIILYLALTTATHYYCPDYLSLRHHRKEEIKALLALFLGDGLFFIGNISSLKLVCVWQANLGETEVIRNCW